MRTWPYEDFPVYGVVCRCGQHMFRKGEDYECRNVMCKDPAVAINLEKDDERITSRAT